jgi:glycosyltransferase involved in cell wall biosynthesis
MNRSRKVSILITTYNAMPYLPMAVEGIIGQTYKNWELIIVDDHSSDNSAQYLKSIVNESIKVYKNQGKGRGVALNYGLSICKGEYIAINDADDISLPNRLKHQVEFLDKHLEYGLLGSNFIKINSKGVRDYSDKYTDNEVLRRKLSLQSCIQHSTVMVRRDLLEKIGRYNLKIKFMYDRDMFIRIAECARIANLKEHLVYINQHEKQFFLNTYSGWQRYFYQIKYSRIAIGKLSLPIFLYFSNFYHITKNSLRAYLGKKLNS